MNGVVWHLRRAVLMAAGEGPTDARLLEAFLVRRDEAAFEALLRRHGPMVWGVCRRLLGEQDAEDAFQATFLVLARKAASVRPRERVGNWLYGVAYRTAMKARAMNAKRRARERQAACRQCEQARADEAGEELLAHLDAELSRLPDRYREPVVLCELEGRGRREVARQLGIPEGTLSSRLATARKMLARRLARHGTAPSAATLATLLAAKEASAGLPPALLAGTGKAATQMAVGQSMAAGAVPASVMALTEGVIKAMLLNKLKALGAVALVVCLSAGAVALTYRPAQAAPQKPAQAAPDELAVLRLEIEALRKDLQAVRERVKTLEAQPKSQGPLGQGTTRLGTGGFTPGQTGGGFGGGAGFTGGGGGGFSGGTGGGFGVPMGSGVGRAKQPDPVAAAQDALEKLRRAPDNKQALEALEKALQLLKEREKKEKPGGSAK